jgi:hypothetical protein
LITKNETSFGNEAGLNIYVGKFLNQFLCDSSQVEYFYNS